MALKRSHATDGPEQLKGAALAAASWLWSLTDVVPPYYVARGKLEAKKRATDDRLLILVNGAWLSVDEPTFGLLSIGERLRVMYTRRARAISIDRYAERNGR